MLLNMHSKPNSLVCDKFKNFAIFAFTGMFNLLMAQ